MFVAVHCGKGCVNSDIFILFSGPQLSHDRPGNAVEYWFSHSFCPFSNLIGIRKGKKGLVFI